MSIRVGVQMQAQSLIDNDPDFVMDRLQNLAGVTEIQLNAYQYYLWNREPRAGAKRPETPVWVRTESHRYAGIGVGHADTRLFEHGGTDILDLAIARARPRGIRIHARFLEGFQPHMSELVPGWERTLGETVYGEPDSKPCWWNPAYRAWWRTVVGELVDVHDIDGVYLGPERDGPLGPTLHNAAVPTCFCSHCRDAAQRLGVDPSRAREGWRRLHQLSQQVQSGSVPVDGVLVSILRLWVQYPEILGWERVQAEGKWGLQAELSGVAKSTRAGTQFGLHICMYGLMWDLFGRATTDYARLSSFADYVKPSVYFDVNAARMHNFIANNGGNVMWRDLRPQTTLAMLYEAMGYDSSVEPGWPELEHGRCSPSYVKREISRCVAGCGGRAQVLGGIGVDIPHKKLGNIEPERVQAAATACLEAGANGLLLSREYEFMRDETLKAAGDAVRAWAANPKTSASSIGAPQ